MPPIRTFNAAIKPAKTERSHEENQERAYIAASRRSDRSLEARVESARRASEIHKRRTGRSLRVTEQDVVNEEMYEEEDDDLPSQYRRLTASLNTSSSDFNRRLATYLTTNVAMREALDRAMAQQRGQQQGQTWNPQLQQQTMHNPAMFGQTYPQNPTMIPPSMMHHHAPVSQQFQAQAANGDGRRPRPASIATKHPVHAASPRNSSLTSPMANFGFEEQRPASSRGSMGVQSTTSSSSASHRAGSGSVQLGHTQVQPESNSPTYTNSKQGDPNQSLKQPDFANQYGPHNPLSPPALSPLTSPYAPLSTQLPVETQMFFTNQGMNLSSDARFSQQPFYSYNPNFANSKPSHPTTQGMSQTLAPSAFETKMEPTAWPTPPSMSSEDLVSPFTATGDANYGFDANNDFSSMSWGGVLTDGQPTPADEFSSLIDVSLWENEPAPAA